MTHIIFDYLDNSSNQKKYDKVEHVEDIIEPLPDAKGIDTIFSLYKVFYEDKTIGYYINTISSTANTVTEASMELINELFPEFYAETFGTIKAPGDAGPTIP